jgi:S2P endopeptidase
MLSSQQSIPAYCPKGQPSVCCSGDAPHTDGVACFSSLPRSTTEIDRCLDPIPVMAENDRKRCSSSSICAENSTCVAYVSPDPLLRIEIIKDEEFRTVLWSGPPLEVWEQGELVLLHNCTFTHCRHS